MIKRGTSATDAIAELQNSPEYQEKLKAIQQKRAASSTQRRLVEKNETVELIAELRSVGLDIQGIGQLRQTTANFCRAIPILIDHLTRNYSDNTKAIIARLLAVREALDGWYSLVSEYKKTKYDGNYSALKDALATAIALLVTEETLPELLALVRDRGEGSSRSLLLRGVKRYRNLVAQHVLDELSLDPDLEKTIKSWKRPEN